MIRVYKEEGHYTIKRVDRLPKKGNANWLYTIKSKKLEKFYRWDAFKSEFEEIQVGGSTVDGSETIIQSGTNVTLTGTGTIADPYIINSAGGGAEYRIVDNRPTEESFSLTEDGNPVSTVTFNTSSVSSNPVENEYVDISSMLADQGNQTETFFQYVSGTDEYYEKLSTSTADISDYRLLSDTEVQTILDSNGYRVFRIRDIQDDAVPVNTTTGGRISFNYDNVTDKVTSVVFNQQYSDAISRFYDERANNTYKLKFYNRNTQDYEFATVTNWTVNGNYYIVDVTDTIDRNNLSVNNRIELFFEIDNEGKGTLVQSDSYFINEKTMPFSATSSTITDDAIYYGSGDNFVKWTQEGGEEILLTISGAFDWRSCFKHSSGYIFFSPMDSGTPAIADADHALYKLDPTDDSITKVIQLTTQECIWGIDEDSNGTIFAGVYSFPTDNGDIYRSTDNGDNWSVVFSPNYGGSNNNHTHSVFVDKSNDYIYVLGGDDYGGTLNFRSIDGGDNWTEILVGQPINQFTAGLAVDGARIFGTDQLSYGRIYRTTDDSSLALVLDTHYQNVFFLRQSDITGWIYAGFKLDPAATGNFRADIYVSKDLGLTWSLYDTISDLSVSEGFWFGSQFHNGKMIITTDYNGGFQNSIMLYESTSLSDYTNVRKVSVSRNLSEFDNRKLLDVYNSSILTIPSSGLPDSFECDLVSTSGEAQVLGDGGGVILDFVKGQSLQEGSFGKIFRKRNKNEYKGVLEFSSLNLNYGLVFVVDFEADSDSAINSHTGTDIDISYVSGKIGNGADFNGTTSHIDYADSDDFSFTNGVNDLPFSIEMWVNFDNNVASQFLFNKQSGASNKEYIIAWNGTDLTIILISPTSASTYIRANHTFTPNISQWYQFGFTYDGSGDEDGIKIYVDGTLVSTTNIQQNTYPLMSNGNSILSLGYNHSASSAYFDGQMDLLRVWKNRELTASEMSQLYNSGSGLSYPF